jgi:hypothetical protein
VLRAASGSAQAAAPLHAHISRQAHASLSALRELAAVTPRGESFLRVHWVAVPQAMRARRANRRRRQRRGRSCLLGRLGRLSLGRGGRAIAVGDLAAQVCRRATACSEMPGVHARLRFTYVAPVLAKRY